MPPIAEAIAAIILKILEIHLETIKALPPDERQAYAKQVMADLKLWRDLFQFPQPKN